MEDEFETRKFINEKINPILEKLVVDMLIHRPANPLAYIHEWCERKAENFKYLTESKPLEESQSSGLKKKPKQEVDSESESESGEENDTTPTLPERLKGPPKQRSSVSAEVYGLWNKKGVYKPQVIPKSEEQKERIRKRLNQSFIFQALDDNEKNIVIDAMDERAFHPGQYVIKQGADGDNLYVVDNGQLDCFKVFKKGEEAKFLKTYQAGESFGELALLYNAPRAATIRAKTDSILFELDRECFNHIVKEAAMKKREKYDQFLKSVEIFSTMDPYERSQIADALKPLKFKKGDYVVKQGEEGDSFFLVEDGNLVAMKVMKPGEDSQKVLTYKAGDYFGELAILRNVPRQASVMAQSDCKLVSLDRLSFKRMLGPIEDILRRNEQKYAKYM